MTAKEAVQLLYSISRETNMPAASHETCGVARDILMAMVDDHRRLADAAASVE